MVPSANTTVKISVTMETATVATRKARRGAPLRRSTAAMVSMHSC